MKKFVVDLNGKKVDFPHYFEKCVGSCHAATALREDWRVQIKKVKDAIGFKYVRFHGLLNDDMSVCSKHNGFFVYSFFNIDSIFDYLLSIDMKPFVELSFMPEVLASGTKTVFHYKGNITPPKKYEEWGDLIEALAKHLIERYGIEEVEKWYFEVWNEPNLKDFWSGTKDEYFQLYKTTANAIKRVNNNLKVGGPVTACNAWIADLIDFCNAENVPLDFISTHHYPTDEALGHGLNMEEALAKSPRGITKSMCEKARKEAGSYPLFYTEWNSSPSCRDSYHDDPFAAAFVVKSVFDNAGLVDIYSFWTFSDIFEELPFPSTPFHGGFGLLNIHGIPKPTFRAFELLHRAGDKLITVNQEKNSLVELSAVIDDKKLMLFIYNHNMPLNPIDDEEVRIEIKGLDGWKFAYAERIDENHANPKKEWIEMGSPEYLNQDMIKKLIDKSKLEKEYVEISNEEDKKVIKLFQPKHGVTAITIEF
ncbi:GH39 family glycosyl hydrolase [Thermoanaerobacterium thermosaccharolyticum]|jgi:Glycosyl hydrolases family 39.|uniref:Glycoside hydrolase family 39 n=2 Tax=Thermoanaerobacterium thermosaccharolyticum TaxID=1517 RepID=D9TT77_THETC|nr:beta-xylosidase [Thermoanaerobacterium thermosaccharolyticum]TCW37989.1 xylan 1,4-beta-xylosidase [Thermohydrogenium kirishiense]ADL68219.1 glycoside hydrolase family 39 [Thermoanaerobacterium thermosaccharolyticum DSM 571]AST58227.1 beta-xylosidase [Thermoanaerobacterium thermosaccharolyticum]KAA5808424.1 beta-xylosidase [Thermoanaerobacterium thermosaccharolyticum]WHE06335.1 beta-xylosidase [Thermoanaerobacterium thermosaccharolyticum]